MPDPVWTGPLASRLAHLSLRPAREREIIDELSQHLDDRYQELRLAGSTHEDAMRVALAEINDERDEDLLAREMRPLRQASVCWLQSRRECPAGRRRHRRESRRSA